MEITHSRALIAIGELASFNKAADRLNLSPPAVFAQVHQLEAELGQKLYRRSSRGLVLTPAGCLLIGHCRRLMQVHDEAVESIKDLDGECRGTIAIGCGPQMSVSILPYLIRAFIATHPNVSLRLNTGNDAVLFEELRSSKVDVILMNLPIDHPDLVQEALWRYELVFVASPGDPLSKQAIATPSDLASRPFILYQRSVVIESAIREFCLRVGFEPKLVMQNDQADSIKELIKMGLGFSLLPLWSVFEEVRAGKLAIVRVPERKLFSVTGLIYRKSKHLPLTAKALRETAHDWRKWLPSPPGLLGIEELA